MLFKQSEENWSDYLNFGQNKQTSREGILPDI